ncbi:DUF4139 domain-containing protein [bacterium]|nr:DUF4139 domain-containing protein [bacterium]
MKKVFSAALLLATIPLALSARELSITIYNQNIALVKDIREAVFDKEGVFKLTDVPSSIEPTSVHFSVLAGAPLTILEQNYQYDLVGTTKLLERYLDQTIHIRTESKEDFEGKLLSSSPSDCIIKKKDGGIVSVKTDKILTLDFPSLPSGLITKPTLVWLYRGEKAGKRRFELSYITGGVNWSADYVAVVDKDDEELGLSGWVTIENRSGTAFPDAKLKLVAGRVHLVRPEHTEARFLAKGAGISDEEKPFVEESFFEYHLYTLTRPTTVGSNETKQLSLFPEHTVDARKEYIYDGARYSKVRVVMEFVNSEEAGLGMPLPEGKVRVYKEDRTGALQFVGEDRIEHTPVDEKVRVYLGDAFDVVAERKKTDYKRLSRTVHEDTYEITVRNHKEEDIIVTVVEHFFGDWTIKDKNAKFHKKDQHTGEFYLPVPADGEKTLTYTVRIRY